MCRVVLWVILCSCTLSLPRHATCHAPRRCRAVSLESIRAGRAQDLAASCWLFEGEKLRWPGFVEFGEDFALTYCSVSKYVHVCVHRVCVWWSGTRVGRLG